MKKTLLSVVLCLAVMLTSIGGLFAVPVFAANETNLLDEGNTFTDVGTATHTLENGVLTVTAAAAGDYVEIATTNGALIADQCYIGVSITSDVLFEVEMRDTKWCKVGFASDNPWAFAGNDSTAGINPGTYNDVMFDLSGGYNWNGWDKNVPLMSVRVIAKAAGTITVNWLVQSDNMNLVDITTANYAGIDGLTEEYNLIGGFAEDWTSSDAQGSSAVVEYDDAGALTVSSTAGAWPAACYDFETPIVVPADSVIAADYTVYQTSRVAIFFGESDINNYDSGEYVDIGPSTAATDLATSQYKGYQLLSDIIPAESIDADGNVTINSVKIWAIGTGKCVKVNELKVLYAAEQEPVIGTYENPYQLDFGMWGRAIVYLEPGAEAYVQAADANGTIVTAYGANEDLEDAADGWFVQYGRQSVYPDATANASFEMNPFSDIFSVMNTSETEGRTIYFALQEAPASNIGTFESGSDVAVENVNGAYVVVGGDYVTVTDGMEVNNIYVAEQDGTLTFSVYSENWFYVINNLTSGVYGDAQWSDSDPVMDTYEVEVAAGDEVQIIINTYDAMSPWAAPEGAVEWSLTFEAAQQGCAHDGLVHMDAVEAGCHMNGNVEYWVCYDCETVWTDEALTMISNIKNVIVPATGEGDLVHFDAVEAGCHMNGNVEYWVCYDCEQVWTDEALTQLSNIKNVIVPATGEGDLVHFDAVEGNCHMNGNVEYWVCYDCEQVWTDEALTQLSNIKNVIVPALGGEVVHVEAKDATCYENGNIEYWYCETCEQVWQDEALTQLTNHKNVIIGATHTNLVHMDAVEANCHMNGNVEYWVCYDCETVWTNEALTEISNIKNVIVPALGGEVVHVEAKDATCYENGNVEHWYCETCEQVWADEALTQLTNHKNVIIGATHTNLVHMDAVEAGCHMNGNVEYWVCYDCGGVWTNETLTEISNIKNVIVPALGGEVVHVEAKDPTATENGNIEHWYCETCEQVWQDEALTQLTNHKNVIIPATGEEEPDLNDAARLFYILNGVIEPTEEDLNKMDVNNDGEFTLYDVARMFYFINELIDEL